MSAISVSRPIFGSAVTGYSASSFVNINTQPIIVSSSYIDFGDQIEFALRFTVNLGGDGGAATSFRFTCDQLSAITFNNTTMAAIGTGMPIVYTDVTTGTSITVTSIQSTSNISVSWKSNSIMVIPISVNFTVTRS